MSVANNLLLCMQSDSGFLQTFIDNNESYFCGYGSAMKN